jgi:hypothetical protein
VAVGWHCGRWYLFERLCVDEDPGQLDDLGGILGDADAVLIACRPHVDHHIKVTRRRVGHRTADCEAVVVMVEERGGRGGEGERGRRNFFPFF